MFTVAIVDEQLVLVNALVQCSLAHVQDAFTAAIAASKLSEGIPVQIGFRSDSSLFPTTIIRA